MDNKEHQSSYGHVLKYTSLFGGIQVFNILIGIVRTKLVAIILGTGGMGLVSLFNATISFINSGTNLGLPTSSVKTLSETYEQSDVAQMERKVWLIRSLSLITALIGVIVCLALSSFFDLFTFSWGSHRLHFLLLSPVVGMMAVIGGEMAILKSVRQLKQLAIISTLNMVAALIISVPIYYFFGQSGIIPALTLMTFVQLLLTMRSSCQMFPFRVSLTKKVFSEGSEMIRLGIAFMLSGLFTAGADFVIRSYLSKYAGLEVLGIFNAGFMLTTTYAGMVFAAMETDYFPRLSGINKDVAAFTLAVNRQIEVTVLLIAPMLLAFMVFMPIVVPLLYTENFIEAVPMAQVIILALYLRAIKLPVAYLTLAKADSRAFLLLEAYSAVLTITVVIVGYLHFGLEGAGWGLFITELVDIVVVNIFAHFRYGYTVSSSVVRYVALQFPLAVAGFLVTQYLTDSQYWTVGILLSLLSLAISIHILRQKTSLWSKLTSRFLKR